MNRKIIFRILVILVTAFIFNNSLKPAVASAEDRGVIVEIFGRILSMLGKTVDIDTLQNIVRKTAHFVEFAAQGALLYGCFEGKFGDRIIYVLFFGLLTACTDEFFQLFFEGRGSQVQDIFIDFSGTVAGLCAGGIIGLGRRRGK